jgi:hypothetical protein
MSGESLVLVRNRATRILMIGEPQEHDFGPGSDPAKRSGHALRVDERAKAPVQIDHAIVGGRLLWFATSQAKQLVAQSGKGTGFPYPDDYVELVGGHGDCSKRNRVDANDGTRPAGGSVVTLPA